MPHKINDGFKNKLGHIHGNWKLSTKHVPNSLTYKIYSEDTPTMDTIIMAFLTLFLLLFRASQSQA